MQIKVVNPFFSGDQELLGSAGNANEVLEQDTVPDLESGAQVVIRVRFHIIRNACIENEGKSQSCMVSKLRIIWKQTVVSRRCCRSRAKSLGTV